MLNLIQVQWIDLRDYVILVSSWFICKSLNQFPIRSYSSVKTRAARRAVSISMFLVFLPQFCGCYILISYSTPYFAEAGSTLTPLQSSILICIVQLIANLFTVILIDRLGRKILFTTSSIGAGLGMIVLALHNFYKDELPGTNWVPMYGLSFTIFIGSVGLLPVPFIITVDVLPANVSNFDEFDRIGFKRETFTITD